MGFPIRKSPDQRIFAPPRSLSQLVTSFVGSWCQGIPLALFIAWPIRDMVLYSWIMQAITDYAKLLLLPSSFQMLSTIKINFLSFKSPWKTSLLPCFHHFNTLFSFQGAISVLLRPEISTQSFEYLFPSLPQIWWARVGSNHRPYDYQSYALASWATGPYSFWWR